jgi:hypothetical protein
MSPHSTLKALGGLTMKMRDNLILIGLVVSGLMMILGVVGIAVSYMAMAVGNVL